jgi:3-dehydroquinate dehydratase
MQNKAVCKKVSSMLSLYIDDKITEQEKAFIEDHISNCKDCYKKFIYLKSLIKNLKDSYKQILKNKKQPMFSIREHERFKENLSPYIDNELDSNGCFEFRKYLMKSKNAQQELKMTYVMQKELRTAFERTQKKLNTDMSKHIINTIKNNGKEHSNIIDFGHFKTMKVAILSGLVLFGAAEIKYFAAPVKSKIQKVIFKHTKHSEGELTDDVILKNMPPED